MVEEVTLGEVSSHGEDLVKKEEVGFIYCLSFVSSGPRTDRSVV